MYPQFLGFASVSWGSGIQGALLQTVQDVSCFGDPLPFS